jgi:nucleoside permease NupC
MLSFGGEMVGVENLTFNRVLGWVFFPLAYLMAVSDSPDHSVRVHQYGFITD